MLKSALFVSLVCVCASLVNAQTLKLSVYSSSNNYWLAVTAIDGTSPTSYVEINEAGSNAWTRLGAMVPGWGYWTYNAPNANSGGFAFPLSFRLTSVIGDIVTINSAVTSFTGVERIVDSTAQYGASSAPPTTATVPAVATAAPPSAAATSAPIVTVPVTSAPVTTAVPATSAPTTKPATSAPTTKPATSAPTTKPATSGCTAKSKVLVPLYVYPGAAWDAVAAGARSVSTVAIINPNSGPAASPDSSYVTYMQLLANAGVEMVGYVYTGYGNRDIAAVKADIDTYATQYPLLKGIFLDEGAADAGKVSYYKTLYDYILSMPGWTHDIINPGIVPDSGYLSASTQIVTLENYGTEVASAIAPSFAQCSNKGQFSAIVHTVTANSMSSIIDNLLSKNYFGYIYITDGAGGCCTYNTLTSYYASMISYIASKQ